jgi:cytochrome c551/c552
MQKSLTDHRTRRWKVLGSALQSSLSPILQSRVRQHCLGRVPAAQAKAVLETEAVVSCITDQFELSGPLVSEKVARRYNVPGESLDQFKNDVETVAKAVLNKQLQP